jgi:hypothetical protein
MSYRSSAAALGYSRGSSRTRKNQIGDRFGELELVKLGYSQYDWFRCPRDHEQLMNVNDMRRREKCGAPPAQCPGCREARKRATGVAP